jgi:hypothetical protein
VFLSGELPRPRSHASSLLRGNLMHIFAGSINEVENYDFTSCLILNLGTLTGIASHFFPTVLINCSSFLFYFRFLFMA